MRSCSKIIGLCLVLFGMVAVAESATAAEPAVCVAVQDCVDNNVPLTVHQCVVASPQCTVASPDRLAISAGVLADRAATSLKCTTSTFKSVKDCNKCYANAEKPLQQRFDGELFHGLLYNSILILEQQRAAKCVRIGK